MFYPILILTKMKQLPAPGCGPFTPLGTGAEGRWIPWSFTIEENCSSHNQRVPSLVICYIAMERSTMPLIGKPSISIRAIEKPWRTVSHNQRVSALWATFFHQNLEEQSGFLICGIHLQRTTAIPLVSPCLGPWKLRLQKLRQQTQGWANGSRSVDIDWNVSWFTFDKRRKFRSQTSDNMDKWKAEQGRGREKRKIRRKKSRRERVRRKKMQMREKVGKSRNTVFF